MFAKAVQDHSNIPALKGVSLSQGLRGSSNTLKPSTSTVHNAPGQSWPTANPLKRTALQTNGGEDSLNRNASVMSKSSMTDLSQKSENGGRVGKLHETVFFDENDFEDDANVNLDADEPMSRQTSSSTLVGYPTLPDHSSSTFGISYPELPVDSARLAARNPPSSQPLPWSSSPIEHKMAPARQPPAPAAKRRKLPWLDGQSEPGKQSAPGSSQASERIITERKRLQNVNGNSTSAEHVSQQSSFTPLPKDKPNNPYPWNKTASAVKEEQKRLRQGHKKLVKDNEAENGSAVASTSKKKSVPRVFLSDEQQHVLDLVTTQKKSVFFTGSAGTGKSVLLREIIKVLRNNYKREPDRVAVTASTGLAACNIGGVTLHSFGGIGLGKEAVPELVKKIKRNQKAKNRWLRTKVLIVDEISMVDGDLFDKLEAIARIIRNNGRPFGGIQLVITGDFFQLPPVPDYGKISKFSFDAATWNTSIEHTIGLTQVFRQKDPAFANMLNEMRLGRLTWKSIEAFRALNRPLGFTDDFEATELFPTRQEVDNANSNRMRNLNGRSWDFKAEDGGSISDLAQREKLLSNCMAPPLITLKKGAQVMLIKNIDDTLVNGSVGKVIAFMDEKTFDIYHDDEEEFQAVETMDLNDEEMTRSRKKLKQMINKDLVGDTSQKWPLVRFAIADGTSRDLLCQRESWKIELPNGEIQASRSQVPLILAWALSIHKAQGQTLERVKVDLGKIFEKGQAYVALSRATCQEGLQILRFDPKKVMAHDKVRNFYDSLYNFEQVAATTVSGARLQNVLGAKGYEEAYVQGGSLSDDEHEALRELYR